MDLRFVAVPHIRRERHTHIPNPGKSPNSVSQGILRHCLQNLEAEQARGHGQPWRATLFLHLPRSAGCFLGQRRHNRNVNGGLGFLVSLPCASDSPESIQCQGAPVSGALILPTSRDTDWNPSTTFPFSPNLEMQVVDRSLSLGM